MATRKSTRSGGKKAPPRRGNEIRTHPITKQEVVRWERVNETFDDLARKRCALDEVLAHLVLEYFVVEAYLSNETYFTEDKARAARQTLLDVSSNLLSVLSMLGAFIRKAGLPTTSPRSMILGRRI